MKLKKLIKESVIIDNITSIDSELFEIKRTILEQLIIEGVDDPGILKMIFMSGGPGSGKSFTAMDIFGIDKKLVSSFSTYGLKMVASDVQFEKALKKNGIDPKELSRIEKETPEFYDAIVNGPDSIRGTAKKLTNKQQSFYEAGRLGMIMDGTGHNYQKIKKQKQAAEKMGYDTYMVFVNTSLEVALERNKNRDRVLPEKTVTELWKDVQENLGKFHGLFGSNMVIVDNTIYKPIDKYIQKGVNKFVNNDIQNSIGKNWVITARNLKNANLIKK